MAIFSSQLFIKEDDLSTNDLKFLMGQTTLYPNDDYSDPAPFSSFSRRNGVIGIPRNYGLRYAKQMGLPIEARCATPRIEWPQHINFSWRGGQKESVYQTLDHLKKYWGGLLDASTGCGKTLMTLSIAKLLGIPILVLIHKKDLIDVWHKDAEKFFPGARCGHVQQDTWDYKDKHITTAVYQTLYSRRYDLPKDFLESFGMIVVEEGHRVAAPTFGTVLGMFPAKYRLGISATWKRKDGLGFLFDWYIGSVAHKMRQTQLTGTVFCTNYPANFPGDAFRRRGKFISAQFITALSNHAGYNAYLANQARQAAAAGRKVLIVSDRRRQLDTLQSMLPTVSTAQYTGSTTPEGRKIAHDAQVILGTYQAVGEGTDIPALDTLIMATPRTDIDQVVGRIRRPHKGKKSLVVLDPTVSHFYARRMGDKRREAYRRLGFKIKELR